jgi:hypothetical protein
MIQPAMVSQVRRLLGQGDLSQRKVAKMTGVSRGTISRIASGKRPDYRLPPDEEESDAASGPPERCGGCGGMVTMPCRLCRVRERMGRTRRRIFRDDDPLALDLQAEHQARYEEVSRLRHRNRL